MEPLLSDHPEKPTSLEKPFDDVNLSINIFISTPDKRTPLLKGNASGAKKGSTAYAEMLFKQYFVKFKVMFYHV